MDADWQTVQRSVPQYIWWQSSSSACWAGALTAWPRGRCWWEGPGWRRRRTPCGWWWWPGSTPSLNAPPACCKGRSRAAGSGAAAGRTGPTAPARHHKTSWTGTEAHFVRVVCRDANRSTLFGDFWAYLLSSSSLAVSSVVIEGSMMSDLLSERLSDVMRLFLPSVSLSSLTSRRSKLTALL